MNRNEAATFARQELNRHGFGHIPFQFDRAKARIAAAHFIGYDKVPHKLTLSEHFCDINDASVIHNAIKHEVAHFLAGFHAGHGAQWRLACRTTGARPSATCPEARGPEKPWKATCRCGKTYSRFRAPKRGYSYSCKTCHHTLTFSRGGAPVATQVAALRPTPEAPKSPAQFFNRSQDEAWKAIQDRREAKRAAITS